MTHIGTSTIACYCHECGETFYEKNVNVELLITMKRTKGWRRGDPLLTWADWVYHCETHCPMCRFIQPPPDCLKDLDHHVALFNKRNKS